MLFAIWLGYPGSLWLVGRFRKQQPSGPQAQPMITAIVATRDDPQSVRARARNLLDTDYPADRIQVVLAVDCEHADTAQAIGSEDARIRVVIGDSPGGKAAALNAAVRASSGDILVFSDTHQHFEPTTIPNLVAALAESRVAAVSGQLELPATPGGSRSLAHYYWLFERSVRALESRVHSCIGVTGAVYAMRRKLWEPLRPHLILDDLHVPMRLVVDGWRVKYVRCARAFEIRHHAPHHEYRRKVRTLTGILQFCAWFPAALSPRRNPVWLQFVTHKLLRLTTPVWVVGIVVGTLPTLYSEPARPIIIAGLILAATGSALAPRRAWRLISETVLLQGAIIVATINGLRGKWDVWGQRAQPASRPSLDLETRRGP